MILKNRDINLAKWKKSKKNWICILYAHWVVETEDIILFKQCDTVYERNQAQCGGVER